MNTQWTIAALLSSALIVGCSDRGTDNAQNLEPQQDRALATEPGTADPANPATPAAPAPAVDNSAARVDGNDTTGARATTGSQPARPAPAPAAPPTARDVAPAPAPPPRPQWREVTVPAGTALPLELMTALSSETATVEMPVRARLRQAVMIDGATVVPAGATLSGNVSEVERAGRVKGRSRLVVRFTEVERDGDREDLRTNPVVFEGEATKGEDATKVGVGAGIGAAIGGVLGGGSGAAKGAAIGGAAGAGTVLATRGREVELASGTNIDATLATPMELRVPVR
ncbi:MAG TPA: hypothetical protein VIX63_02445 [Vicinamibacterales bacterium]